MRIEATVYTPLGLFTGIFLDETNGEPITEEAADVLISEMTVNVNNLMYVRLTSENKMQKHVIGQEMLRRSVITFSKVP